MLKLNNVSKTFNPGTVNEKTALSGLTLDVHDGDFITIIGANSFRGLSGCSPSAR